MNQTFMMFLTLIFLSSCSNQPAAPLSTGKPIPFREDPVAKTIAERVPFTQFQSFWNYYTTDIKLNEDFIGYDKDRQRISKQSFLKKLATGKFQPILINPTDSIRYQLKSSSNDVDKFIPLYMEKFANEQLVYYNMENKHAPPFQIQTLDGVKYTSVNTKGKIVLLKCWFIACIPCVQEMPVLNALVDRYKKRKDIIFLSLATDDEVVLKKFLSKTQFNYQTVANQEEYISKKLNVSSYPTHFLINKEGNIIKVSNDAEQLERFLERMLDKK